MKKQINNNNKTKVRQSLWNFFGKKENQLKHSVSAPQLTYMNQKQQNIGAQVENELDSNQNITKQTTLISKFKKKKQLLDNNQNITQGTETPLHKKYPLKRMAAINGDGLPIKKPLLQIQLHQFEKPKSCNNLVEYGKNINEQDILNASFDQSKNQKFIKAIRKVLILLRFNQEIKKIIDDNRLSSKKAIRYIIPPQLKRKRYILYPEDSLKASWNFLLIIVLLITAIWTPINVCLIEDQDLDDWYMFNIIIDIIFAIDIVINFFSAYTNAQTKTVDYLQEIWINYLTGWFWIDIIAIFPFDSAFSGSDNNTVQYNKLFRLLRLPRLYKIVKLMKVQKGNNNLLVAIFDLFQMNIAIRKVCNILTVILLMSHLASCLFYYTAKYENFSPETWVAKQNLIQANYSTKYVTAFYWTFQTLCAIGYGDIPAETMLEQFVAISWMIFGVGFYSFTIGDLTTLIMQMNEKAVVLQRILNQFDDVALMCDIPEVLKKKVKRFFETNFKENQFWGINIDQFLQELPTELHNELITFTYVNIIEKIQILKLNLQFSCLILPKTQMDKFLQNDIIYREDDPADEVYFIIKGQVGYFNEQYKQLVQIEKGQIFGEYEVIQKTRRKAFAIAMTDCLVITCNADTFNSAVEKCSDIRKVLNSIARQRKKDEIDNLNSPTKKKNKLMDLVKQKITFEKYNPLLSADVKKKQFQQDPTKMLIKSKLHYSLLLKSLKTNLQRKSFLVINEKFPVKGKDQGQVYPESNTFRKTETDTLSSKPTIINAKLNDNINSPNEESKSSINEDDSKDSKEDEQKVSEDGSQAQKQNEKQQKDPNDKEINKNNNENDKPSSDQSFDSQSLSEDQNEIKEEDEEDQDVVQKKMQEQVETERKMSELLSPQVFKNIFNFCSQLRSETNNKINQLAKLRSNIRVINNLKIKYIQMRLQIMRQKLELDRKLKTYEKLNKRKN